jgi:hypothetical protein
MRERACVNSYDSTVTHQDGLRIKQPWMLMHMPSCCGTTHVREEINGAGVRVADARAVHGHAAGDVVMVVPFHGINDEPLLCLGLSDHCYKVTSCLMDNGTVWHRALGLWLRASSCSTEDGMGKYEQSYKATSISWRNQQIPSNN